MRAVAHADEDGLPTIRRNWRSAGLQEASWPSGANVAQASAFIVALPPRADVRRQLGEPSVGADCREQPSHCSTLFDDWTPRSEDAGAAYLALWQDLLRQRPPAASKSSDAINTVSRLGAGVAFFSVAVALCIVFAWRRRRACDGGRPAGLVPVPQGESTDEEVQSQLCDDCCGPPELGLRPPASHIGAAAEGLGIGD